MSRFSFLKEKLSQDILWTVGSFAVLAFSGILINLAITGLRDASALGVFNLTYAVYIVSSQIAVMGIHFSVLRQAASLGSREDRAEMVSTGLLMALAMGAIWSLVLYLGAPLLARVFDSQMAGEAIRYSAFGLLVFPLNKVLISFINGLRHMRAFSIFQASRYILILLWVVYVSFSSLPFEFSTLGFLLSEILVAFSAIVYLVSIGQMRVIAYRQSWIKRHFAFGSKSCLAGLFIEMNSRIDILLIGVFLNEREVGIYSFAAMLVDGLYQLLVMIRVNFNPMLVASIHNERWGEAQKLLSTMKKYGFASTALISVALLGAFVFFTTIMIPAKGLNEGTLALCILLCGLTLISAYVPFDNLLMMSGHPGFQAFQQIAVIICNAGLNILLIPHIGINGAAVATAVSYLVGIAVMMKLVHQTLGWNLISNVARS